MSHHKHSRLHNSKEDSGGREFVALALLLILGLATWVWWKNRTAPERPETSKPEAVVARTNQAAIKTIAAPASTNIIRSQTKPTTSPPAPSPIIPALIPDRFPRPPSDVFEAQVALARNAFSSGSLDGLMGSQTRAALRAFQRRAALSETGELDGGTKSRLSLASPPTMTYTVTTNDVARLQPLSKTWLGKSQQTALDYETILELVAEKGRASPNLIRRLNPTMDWTNVLAETAVRIPDVQYPPPEAKAGFAVIGLSEKTLDVFDAETNLLAHFPCSIAARVEKRPVGELHVSAIAPNPDYTFNPEGFPESPEAQQLKTKLILPPGPNNPVGTAWISLDKPGYGMHGTPSPEQVGRTESHGCFRLANWNAEYLLKLVWIGMPVRVEP